jgi:hypothetical protein
MNEDRRIVANYDISDPVEKKVFILCLFSTSWRRRNDAEQPHFVLRINARHAHLVCKIRIA